VPRLEGVCAGKELGGRAASGSDSSQGHHKQQPRRTWGHRCANSVRGSRSIAHEALAMIRSVRVALILGRPWGQHVRWFTPWVQLLFTQRDNSS
jgi:hypothetical protein